jgi:ribonuclease HI
MHEEVISSNIAEIESSKYDGYKEVAKYRLLNDASILTAELYAIHQALLRIPEATLQDFVIYFDSLSSLESIEQLYPTQHPLLSQIQDVIQSIKNIAFVWVWVPRHCNIQGNETSEKSHKSTSAVRSQDEHLRFETESQQRKLSNMAKSMGTINQLDVEY